MKTQLLLTATGDRYPRYADAAARQWRKVCPTLAGVTIAGERAADLVGIGHLPPALKACAMKLHAFDLIPHDCDSVLYADLDIWPVSPTAPGTALEFAEFACVRDRWDDGEVNRVADAAGIPRHQYFNAGLFYARRSAARVLEGAQPFFDKLKWWDQTGLNVSRLANLAVTTWLPWRMNAMDYHDAGLAIACSHAPHHALEAWEKGAGPVFPKLPDPVELIRSFDLTHPWSTAACHLEELAEMAGGRCHVLEVGTFRGHAAWAMAAAGALVTTLDPAHETSSRLFRDGLSIDAMRATGAQWLQADPDGRYDMIFHDSEHGLEIIPELTAWWFRLNPAGVLAIHDAEQLQGWTGAELPGRVAATSSYDDRGRQLLALHKA